MADTFQHGLVTTIHDLGAVGRDRLEQLLEQATRTFRIGLILPVTADDMRARPFEAIVAELEGARYVDQIVVVLGRAPREEDYREALAKVEPLGPKAQVLWTDGPRVQALYEHLQTHGLDLREEGKGRAVWTAFGYLLGDPGLKAFVLHDCDIASYDRVMLARLCFPMAHPGLDFEFCKAYYARVSDRMHGRVTRLLVTPFLRALGSVLGPDRFIAFLDSFRYPLSGEFAVSATLARSIRVPADWGLEVGTLAEVYRNTSVKRVCQVDLCRPYEHKHQELSLGDPGRGLLKMATDILITLFRALASTGRVFQPGHFITLRSAYLRTAQDAIRQYHADAMVNGLKFDRHEEEQAVEAFAQQIVRAGEAFQEDPSGGEAIPNWARVLTAFPELPLHLREAAKLDREGVGSPHAETLP